MKKIVIFLLIIFSGLLANAQTETTKPTKVNTIKAAAPVSKRAEIAKEGKFVAYEANLVAGNLTFTKGYQKGDGQALETIYTLVKSKDPTFNNRKPVRIGLSRKSFDSVFTYVSREMVDKRAILDKYISDQKISLDDEKGWVALVRYYNSL